MSLRTSPAPTRDDDLRDDVEGAGAFLLGSGILDFSSLDDRLARAGYERLAKPPLLIGGEGRVVFANGLVAGGRGMAVLFPSSTGPNNTDATFAGGFGMLDFGFALVHTPSILFTLTGGIGGYGVNLAIANHASADFDDVLADSKRSASMARGGLLAGLTLGLDGRVPFGRWRYQHSGFVLMGLRVTGLFGPALGDWKLEHGATAKDGPAAGLSGGLATLAFGFGGGRVAAATRGARR